MNRYGRPPTARHLLVKALEYNEQGLRLLAATSPTGGDGGVNPSLGRALTANLTARWACWRVLEDPWNPECWGRAYRRLAQERRVLAPAAEVSPAWLDALAASADKPRQRRAVERLRRRCHEPLGPTALQARALESSLVAESRALGDLADGALVAESTIQARLVNAYRGARRAVARRPGGSRSREALERLAGVLELLEGADGRNTQGYRQLLDDVNQSRWLRGLARGGADGCSKDGCSKDGWSKKDVVRLEDLARRRRRVVRARIRSLAEQGFAASPRGFSEWVAWQCFCRAAENPWLLACRGGYSPDERGERACGTPVSYTGPGR